MKAWRNDAVAKVSGRARYADDYKFPGMLHAAPVYTDHVHARIIAVHTEEAQACAGVVGVYTAADAPGNAVFGQIQRDYAMLAGDRIRMHGDVVALVVAETRAQAMAAAAKVSVTAEALPPVLDPEEAFRDEVLIHPEKGTNLINHHKVRTGDVAAGFAESALVLEEVFQTQFVEHAYIEPESAVAVPGDDGVMRIYGSMQHPFSTRRFTATLLGLPLSDVEVITIPMGGGFGGKDDTAAIVSARAALAARLTGRPVKLTYTREWSMRESYKRHPYKVYYKMGVGADGSIKAAEVKIFADGGAYCSVTPWVTWRSTVQCCGPYQVPNVCCDTYGVHTNNVFTGAFRGFGSPQMNFIVEQLVERAAQKLGMDEIAFRRRNMVTQGCTTITQQKLDGHTVSLEQALSAVMEKIDYANKRARCGQEAGDGDEVYGIGLAMSYRGMSLGAEGIDLCAAIINGQFDGSILVETGIHENGQGSESAMVLCAAEHLGVRRERIRYRRSSTSNIMDSATTVASRGTLMGTSAIVLAANKLKAQMAEVLAPQLRCEPGEVRFADDCLHGAEGHRLTWDEAVWQMFLHQEHPYAAATFKAPDVSWDEETGHGNAYFTWVYGCQAVEVMVNRKSGQVRLLQAVAAHDVGKAVNPAMLLGQIYGGMTQGYGYALKEEVLMKDGRITNTNLGRYKIPKAEDVPDFQAIVIENPDPMSASKAKGVGEPALELMAPAIANAVRHATGHDCFRKLPLRVEPF